MPSLWARLLVISSSFLPLLAVPPDPFIGTLAGGGPEDVPALQAMLAYPRAVAAAPDGGFYVGTAFNVYHVDPAGRLRRIAGDGSNSSTGDGGSALAAGIQGADAIAVDHTGNLYIASSLANRVRRIDAATGIIS